VSSAPKSAETAQGSEDVLPRPQRGTRPRVLLPYFLLLPSLVALAAILYPFGKGLWWSLTNYDLSSGEAPQFIGLTNYQDLMQSGEFWFALRLTLIYSVVVIVVEVGLGLAVALLLDQDSFASRFFRSTLIVPLTVPPVVGAIMWRLMMQSNGILNSLLGWIHVGPWPWLGSVNGALPSVVLIDVWMNTPFAALILFAGLRALPIETKEAALVDGASSWRLFQSITLPYLQPFFLIVLVLRGIDTFKVFDIIYATTSGGPGNATTTLNILAYFQGIRYLAFGNAMSEVMVLWLLSYVFAFVLIRWWQRSARNEAEV
jgi:multiple sugar transport system permease protein